MLDRNKYRILVLSVSIIFSFGLQAQKTKAELKNFIAARSELLKGKDFWLNDSTALATYTKVDTMVRNLYLKALFQIERLSWRTVNYGGPDMLLTKYDISKDEIADEFGLEYSDGRPTKEFGFIFDLNMDKKIDYIVYNGGVVSSHDGVIYYYFYHMIDTNYDGSIDTFISSIVNQAGETWPDPHKILWIADTDGDKKAEAYKFIDIRTGESFPVEAVEGIWSCNTVFGEKTLNQEDTTYFDPYTKLLMDLNRF